jgi:dTMP kinase
LVLIVIDGLDASGKTTHSLKIRDFLRKKEKTVYLRFHPSNDNLFGIKTEQFLHSNGTNAHFTAAFFYMMDVIRSILLYYWRKYDYMIFIRYLMGTAYLPSPLHIIAYHFFASLVPTSNHMFFLDVCEEEAYKRVHRRQKKVEMFENLKELRRIRHKALYLAEIGNWIILKTNRSIESVNKEIRNLLQNF